MSCKDALREFPGLPGFPGDAPTLSSPSSIDSIGAQQALQVSLRDVGRWNRAADDVLEYGRAKVMAQLKTDKVGPMCEDHHCGICIR